MAELMSTLAQLTLANGMSITFEAISPTTGAAITGVKVSNVAVYCAVPDAEASVPGIPEPEAPLFIPIPQNTG